MTRQTLPRLGIVFDLGAAGANDVLSAAWGLCDVVFVCDGSLPYVASQMDILREFGTVCDVAGLSRDAATDAVRACELAGVVTFSEFQLRRTADLAQGCGLRFHTPRTARLLTDKLAQREALRRASVPSTRCRAVRSTAEVAEAVAEVGLPAIVKPRHGVGSRDTCRVDTLAECLAAVALLLDDDPASGEGELVVEGFLRGDPSVAGEPWGDYVSVESIVLDGEIQHACVTGKLPFAEPFRETGMFVPATLAEPVVAAVTGLASATIRAVGVRDGATQTELKLTPDGPRVIEINGRLGGYVAEILHRATDFDLVRATMAAALGQRVRIPPLTYRHVAFQYFLAPPPEAGTLVRLDGVEQVRALDGVAHVDIRARPGQRVDWRVGTGGHLGTVYGHAPDHRALAETLRRVDQLVVPHVDTDVGSGRRG